MSKPPIFIVGVQRSGTTLLAALLAAHSRLSCGPETHFFRWLAQTEPDLLCAEETWPETAASFLNSIDHTNYKGEGKRSLLAKYNLSGSDVAAYLADKQPSVAAVLAAVTEPYMRKAGKQRWVEKTPDHIEYLPLIRACFPNSPIIRIVRDPRDVALSLMKVPWGANSFLEGLFFWQQRDRASIDFFAADPLCYTLRFEDLLTAPQPAIEAVCHFIGEPFEASMLDTSTTGQQVNSAAVSWKSKASQPIDAGRIAAWQQTLTAQENRLAEAILGNRLADFVYPREVTFDVYGEMYPTLPLPLKYAAGLTAVAAEGVRFWRKAGDDETAVKIYLGDPGADNWLGQGRLEQLSTTATLSRDLLKSRLSRRLIYWVQQKGSEQWSGIFAYLLKELFLLRYSRRIVL